MPRSARLDAVLATLSTLGRTSAEMAFYFALSFVPFVGLTFAAASTWLPPAVGEPLARSLVEAFPPEAGLDPAAIAAWADAARATGWLAAGVLLAALSSFRFLTSCVRALAEIGRAGAPSWEHRLRSVASAVVLTVVWAAALLAISFVLLVAPGLEETLVASGWFGAGAPTAAAIARLLAPAVLLLTFAVTYRMVPGLGARGAALWLGAGFATAGWIAVAEGVRRALPAMWGAQSLYGTLGSFVLFLLWSWANGWVILAGGLVAGRRLRG